jgi:hypothetical protein
MDAHAPHSQLLPIKELGMDKHYATITLHKCAKCDRLWLRYHYENEAFTASGRWYLGTITPEQARLLTAENAKETLERLSWYFCGGSYFDGRVGKSSGRIWL